MRYTLIALLILISGCASSYLNGARNGDLAQVKAGIESYGVNYQGPSGQTALLKASIMGHQEIVEFLLKVDADPNLIDNSGVSPLFGATQGGHQGIVELLLSSGAYVNYQEPLLGRAALHKAVLNGSNEITRLLLDADADIDIRDKEGSTAVIFATAKRRYDLAQLLIEHGANLNIVSEVIATPLMAATRDGNLEFVKYLISKGVDVNVTESKANGNALRYAITDKRYQIAKYLLDQELDINHLDVDGHSALYLAAHFSDIKMMEILLDRGADPNLSGDLNWTPLHHAANHNKLRIAQLLMKVGADPAIVYSEDSRTPLDIARENNNPEMIKLLSGGI